MENKTILNVIFYLWGIASIIMFFGLTAIQLKRLIKKLKWVYIDWLVVTWILSYLWMFIFMILTISFSLADNSVNNDEHKKYRWISYSIMWLFIRMFEVVSITYPVLFIIYYTKLSDLRNDKPFNEVKKSINRLELVAILTIILIITICFIIGTIPNIVMYSKKNWHQMLENDSRSRNSNSSWEKFRQLRNAAFYFYELLNIVILVIQGVIFCYIKKTMKYKLNYYYERAMKGLKILLLSHYPFLISNTLLNAGFLTTENDYNFYL